MHITDVSCDLTWQLFPVEQSVRSARLKQKPCVLWFTGLSGAGKSTVAGLVESLLFQKGYLTYVLDGDNVRHGLCRDLDFTHQGRSENIRRVSEVSKLLADAGLIVLTAFISPFRHDRALARALIGDSDYVEIFINASFDVCEARDPKGLYKKAREKQVAEFTGIDSPYEPPVHPELIINTDTQTAIACAEKIVNYLYSTGRLVLESTDDCLPRERVSARS